MNPRVVLDTNVLVSGLLGGTSAEVILRWRSGEFNLLISAEILTEYEAVLTRPKFKLPQWVIDELLDYVRDHAYWVVLGNDIKELARDPSDTKFLDAAVSGQADWLVSGDKDLVEMGEFRGTPIVTPRQFLDLL